MLPPEPRLPLARRFIDRGQYFVVHAPRQTGKTTILQALAHSLGAERRYVALRISCEAAAPAGDDYPQVQRDMLDQLRRAADDAGLTPEVMPPDPWPAASDGVLLKAGLRGWAAQCPKPLVLFFDEIDALEGVSLVSVLRQLRDGYTSRPAPFPHSVILCGVRNVRDYRAAAGGDPTRLGTSSPFNIKIESLRIGDFSADELRTLYAQHTDETGQTFTSEAVDLAFDYSQGQPWLTNAIAYEIVDRMEIEPPEPITGAHVDEAKERLILARATHLDSLAAKLSEPRVRRVVEPLIAGDVLRLDPYDDDLAYLRDLGLIAQRGEARVANPIYREVIVRVLSTNLEANVVTDPRRFVLPDGRLDFRLILEEFAGFWSQHGDVLAWGEHYHEVAPQLVLMAYLQRVVNGGGYIDREYGVGRGRIDLTVRWPHTDADGKRVVQREAVELKVWHQDAPDPTGRGLEQLDSYLDGLRLDHGTLVVFDRHDPKARLPGRVAFADERTPTGRPVTVLRA